VNCCLQLRVRVGLVCCVQRLEVKSMLLLVTFSRSGAGTPLLPASDSAVRQWQVGCGSFSPQLIERSIPASRKPRLIVL
jgi:hypothetical protein